MTCQLLHESRVQADLLMIRCSQSSSLPSRWVHFLVSSSTTPGHANELEDIRHMYCNRTEDTIKSWRARVLSTDQQIE
jgi:hypothetical protein